MISRGVRLCARVDHGVWLTAFLMACVAVSPLEAVAQSVDGFRDETARRLLEALDEQGMPDVSLWLLERLDDPAAGISSELQSELAYRKALALVGVGRSEPSVEKRQQVFAAAQQAIDAFLASPVPATVVPENGDQIDQLMAAIAMLDRETRRINAGIQQGKLRQERARLMHAEAAKQAKVDGQTPKHVASPEAAAVFRQATESFRSAERLITSKPIAEPADESADSKDDEIATGEENSLLARVRQLLEQVNAAVEEPRPRASRDGRSRAEASRLLREWQVSLDDRQDGLRNKLLEVRLLLGEGLYEVSTALPEGSDDWMRAVEESIAVEKEMYEKYRTLLAGQFARVSQGRGEAALARSMPVDQDATPGESARDKQFEKALATLADVRTLAGGGAIESLRAKAFNVSLECWLEMLPADGYASFDGMDDAAVRLALAGGGPVEMLDRDWLGFKYRTALLLSRVVEASQSTPGQRSPLLANAGRTIQRLATTVAKANRDFAAEARELLSSSQDIAVAEDFASLMDQASISIDAMKAATTPAEVSAARADAMAAIRRALPLAEEDDLAAVNRARYTLTFLLYESGRLLDAAALGEFLTAWYPNAPGSLQAARIAMASWQKLSTTEQPALAAEARLRCGQVAEQILEAWPEDPASRDAAAIAISAVASSGDPARIFSVVDKIPAEIRSSDTSLRAGIAAWKAISVLQSGEMHADASSEVTADDIAGWKSAAAALLDTGLGERSVDESVGMLTVAGALARCQIAMSTGDLQAATAVLENPIYGPWTVVNAGNKPAGAAGSMAEDILQVALPLFIQTEQIAKAEAAMTKLEAVAADPSKLIATYLRLGRELQAQLEQVAATAVDGRLDAESRRRGAAILAGFERFLDAVGSQDSGMQSKLWVASTYLELGSSSLRDDGPQGIGVVVPKAKADTYLARAASTYESLLTSDDEQAKRFEPSVRFKLAELYRVIGQFDDALKNIGWILGDPARVNWIDGQFEAARILQQAGEASEEAAEANALLTEAIVGRTEGAAKLWGWGGLANRLSRKAIVPDDADDAARKSAEQFFQARLELARCRKTIAEKVPAGRNETLAKAERDITVTYRLYPELGGERMKAEFDALLKQIQKELEKPADGLVALDGSAVGS